MTDNEKLIESAKDALANYDIAKAHRVSVAPDRLALILSELVAVCEKAHTPTDEERKALADLRYTVHGGSALPDGVHRVGYPAATAILAAGFRRSEAPEPSAEDAAVTLTTEAVEANREYIEPVKQEGAE